MDRIYPKPTDIGGTLIRRVIALFKERGQPLPLQGRIAISVSGGVDSLVLAHLLCTYGRKVIAKPAEQVTLLHFDHQWRPESATVERATVQALARKLDVAFLSVQLAPPSVDPRSDNWEDDARQKRQEVYARLRRGKDPVRWVLTAHHQDDVIETLVWRFFRGEFLTHREGILFKHHHCLRPFLRVSKEELYRYARDEGVAYHEDPTNRDPQQTRAHFRQEWFPRLEARFPGFRASLLRYVKTPAARGIKSRRPAR